MLIALLVLAPVLTGLLVGIELAVTAVVNPTLRSLPIAASLAGRARCARLLGRAMPFWYASALLAVGALALVVADRRVAVGIAALLLAVCCVLSVLLLVPINRRVASWSSEHPPSDWARQLRQWDRLHLGRVGLLLVALLLVTVGAVSG